MNNEKVFLTLRVRKRHIVALCILVAAGLLIYTSYFREFMTLPQTAASMLKEIHFDSDKKLLVVAPHCDDEVLGQAGVIKRAVDSGSEVKVAIATDCSKHRNGKLREEETKEALKLLGVNKGISFWRFSEGRGKTQEETDGLISKLEQTLREMEPDYIFIPHPKDTHEDHSWVGQTFRKVAYELRPKDKVMYYLIHYNFLKFPSPPGLRPESYLTPPIKLITLNEEWFRFELKPEEVQAKEEAILKYKSQLKITKPVLNRLLFDFVRRNELFMIERGS